MHQAFLNEPTIEGAFDAYLTRWHLPSVQSSWKDKAGRVRKPSLAQFSKRFGDDYARRQKWLAKQNGELTGTALGVLERDDVRQQLAEALVEDGDDRIDALESKLDRLIGALTGEAQEPEEILGSAGGPGHLADQIKEQEPKFVKPENFDELPRSGQVYFFLHRAKEAGQSYAIVPLKRGVAAECISQIKDDGREYAKVVAGIVKSK